MSRLIINQIRQIFINMKYSYNNKLLLLLAAFIFLATFTSTSDAQVCLKLPDLPQNSCINPDTGELLPIVRGPNETPIGMGSNGRAVPALQPLPQHTKVKAGTFSAATFHRYGIIAPTDGGANVASLDKSCRGWKNILKLPDFQAWMQDRADIETIAMANSSALERTVDALERFQAFRPRTINLCDNQTNARNAVKH
ncbi:MAG: hypothetical protein JO006_13170 [Paucibacter sp.]|nr:hypothetical protein [Roseateles sp.]